MRETGGGARRGRRGGAWERGACERGGQRRGGGIGPGRWHRRGVRLSRLAAGGGGHPVGGSVSARLAIRPGGKRRTEPRMPGVERGDRLLREAAIHGCQVVEPHLGGRHGLPDRCRGVGAERLVEQKHLLAKCGDAVLPGRVDERQLETDLLQQGVEMGVTISGRGCHERHESRGSREKCTTPPSVALGRSLRENDSMPAQTHSMRCPQRHPNSLFRDKQIAPPSRQRTAFGSGRGGEPRGVRSGRARSGRDRTARPERPGQSRPGQSRPWRK